MQIESLMSVVIRGVSVDISTEAINQYYLGYNYEVVDTFAYNEIDSRGGQARGWMDRDIPNEVRQQIATRTQSRCGIHHGQEEDRHQPNGLFGAEGQGCSDFHLLIISMPHYTIMPKGRRADPVKGR
ncbi:hypothetical protein HAX54_020549 [Datura stramonium]|uniref:Uncharacterized protein n=1 Tax=Datura stramonium TaxID=4076 RepID=A0ABS8UTB8_DATST|nr:hypothetical protein [Datura stramonium]